jgi:fibronectin-binding autotransporter adhesin
MGAHLWTTLTGGVTMTGGTLQSNEGVSTLTGPRIEWGLANLTINASANTATIAGRLGLRTNVTMNVADGAAATDLMVSSAITESVGSFGLNKSGAGTMVLSGNNIYTGNTTISAGTLEIASTGLLGGGTYAGAIANNSSFIVGSNSNQTLSGVISGTGVLTKNGTGTITLSGANTYSGGTIVNAGTLSVEGRPGGYSDNLRGTLTINQGGTVTTTGDSTGLGYATGPSALVVNGGTFSAGTNGAHLWTTLTGGVTMTGGTLQSNEGVSTLTGTRIEWGLANLTINASANTATIAGRLGLRANVTMNVANGAAATDLMVSSAITESYGSFGLNKSGAGTMVLSGSNIYTSSTTVSAGTLQFAKIASLYNNETASWTAANLVVNSGATASFNVGGAGEFTSANIDTLKALGGSTTGFKNGSAIGLDTSSGNFTYASNITNTNGGSNALGLTKLGSNTLTLTGTNTYSGGTTVSAGKLTGTTSAIQGAVANNAAVEFNQSTNGTFAGAMSGTGSLTKSGAGTLTMSGANSYAGGTTVSAGKLTGTTSAIQGAVANNAAVEFNQSTNGTYAGAMSGSGSLTKSGAGTLALSGTSSYTGATVVSDGLLVVNGSISTSILTTIQNGAVLGGSGTVGALTVLDGGTVAPGNSPGILSTGAYNQAGTLSLQLDGTLAGVEYDQVKVNGTVNLSGSLTASVGYTPVNGQLLFILNNDGADAIIGTFSGIADLDTIDLGGYQWKISYTANYVGSDTGTFTGGNDIVLKAVPEPSALVLLGLSTFCLVSRRRRMA